MAKFCVSHHSWLNHRTQDGGDNGAPLLLITVIRAAGRGVLAALEWEVDSVLGSNSLRWSLPDGGADSFLRFRCGHMSGCALIATWRLTGFCG